MPESTLFLCQSRLYPPVRDLGFGLCVGNSPFSLSSPYTPLSSIFLILNVEKFVNGWLAWLSRHAMREPPEPLYPEMEFLNGTSSRGFWA